MKIVSMLFPLKPPTDCLVKTADDSLRNTSVVAPYMVSVDSSVFSPPVTSGQEKNDHGYWELKSFACSPPYTHFTSPTGHQH